MTSKLFRASPHEAENQIDITLSQAFELLQPQLRPPFPLTIPSPAEYSKLNQAILYGILTETHFGKVHITHLHAIITDGYSFFVNLLVKIVFESYPKLLQSVRVNLIWVTSQMIDVAAIGVEGLLIGLMRQIVGGDFSDGNLWLSRELIRVLVEKFDYLLEEPLILTSALFTYLRLLADHYRLSGVHSIDLEGLKRLEIDFCVRVLRNHFSLCLPIGRDLVRLLQDLVYIPEFGSIWKDLLLNPAEFRTPEFSDISQLYCLRTSSRYFLLRITPEMEIQMKFLLTHVRWGHQRRYQAWFAKKFLSVPENETIVPDIVRFICCAHHPPNEIIQSDIISRWAVIGWLLKCCRKNYVEANTKLALFYDWMFFDEKTDNIMNIEPAILLMVNSIPKYIDMVHTLLEFLFLLVDNYDIHRKNVIAQGVSSAFHVLVKRGVIHSFEAVSSCSLLSPLLKERLAYILSDFKSKDSEERSQATLPHCSLEPLCSPSASCPDSRASLSTEVRSLKRRRESGVATEAVTSPSVLESPDASHGPLVVADKTPITIIEKIVQSLGETIKHSNTMGLHTLGEVLFLFADLGSSLPDKGVLSDCFLRPEVLACQITEAFKSNGYEMFAPLKCPMEFNCDDELQSATALVISTFIFCPSKKMQELILFWSKNGCPVGPRLLSYASRLYCESNLMNCSTHSMNEEKSGKISNSDVPFLKHHIDRYISFVSSKDKDSPGVNPASNVDLKLVAKLVEGAFASYNSFLTLSNNSQKEKNSSFSKLLFFDLLSCCRWEEERLKSLLCGIFCCLSELSTSKEEFIQLVVSQFNHVDLVHLQFEISLRRFSMFGQDIKQICLLIKRSLNWGFMVQQKFWGLIASELAVSKVQVEKVVVDCSVLFDPRVHSTAIEGLFTLCTRCAPTPELVAAVMSLPDKTFGDFAAAVLAHWVVSNGSMLFNSMAQCLEKLNKDRDSVLVGVTSNSSSILGLSKFLNKQGIKSIDCLNKVWE